MGGPLRRSAPSRTPLTARVWGESAFNTARDVPVADGTVRVYSTDTDAPILLCLHGAGSSSLSFCAMAEHLAPHLNVVALDWPGHGHTAVLRPDDLDADRLVSLVVEVVTVLLEGNPHHVTLLGHSLGGAIATRLAGDAAYLDIVGDRVGNLIVVDVCEGVAIPSLKHMPMILRRRPRAFKDLPQLIRWAGDSNTVREPESARFSMPDQVVEEGGQWVWKVDLMRSEEHWTGWFTGTAKMFNTTLTTPRCLIVANMDRLDGEHTVGHMQGKYQVIVVMGAGHHLHEDRPKETAQHILRHLGRYHLTKDLEGKPLFPVQAKLGV